MYEMYAPFCKHTSERNPQDSLILLRLWWQSCTEISSQQQNAFPCYNIIRDVRLRAMTVRGRRFQAVCLNDQETSTPRLGRPGQVRGVALLDVSVQQRPTCLGVPGNSRRSGVSCVGSSEERPVLLHCALRCPAAPTPACPGVPRRTPVIS